MKIRTITAGGLVLVGAAFAGTASADPYGMWHGTSIDGSFNPVTTTNTSVSKSEDDHSSYSKDDHSSYSDTDRSYNTSNWSSAWSSYSDVFKPEQSQYKFQDQQAGHTADAYVTGSATGHDVSASGSRNNVSVGNDQTFVAGPYFYNNNQNNPQTQLLLNSTVAGGVAQDSQMVGRDLKTIVMSGDIGRTIAGASGDVSQSSASTIGQSGDSSNSIADPQSVTVSK